MKSLILMLLVVLGLIGCATAPNNPMEANIYSVHAAASRIAASSTRLNDQWVISAAHNESILKHYVDDIHVHPKYDVLIYKSDGSNVVPLGKIKPMDDVIHYGYRRGHIKSCSGVYIGDTISTNQNNTLLSVSSACIFTGMSGGGVYNSKGELVGISIGHTKHDLTYKGYGKIDHPTVFLQLTDVQNWLSEVTGQEFYPEG